MNLFKAIRFPPAKYLETVGGGFPEASKLITSLREAQIGVGRAVDDTSNRCWTRRPEGPAPVSFGKDLRTERMLKLEPSDTGSWVISGIEESSEAGCLDSNKFHYLEPDLPMCMSILQAFPNIPA